MNRHVAPRWRWILLLVLLTGAPLAGSLASTNGGGPKPPGAVAVFSGGCYWGVESVFRHVRGVESATSGYAVPAPAMGGQPEPHAEAVRIVYDSTRITYRKLLDVFFSVVHDPTELDRQGPDVGPEYRSIVYVADDRQRGVVQAYIDSLTAAHLFPRPIVTEVAALGSFDPVDASQQNYAERHPTDPYILTNDVPKIEALRQRFPRIYRS